ncbi:MAG: hypothetical protein AB1353_00915 [Aquificota bacterium]
MSKRIESFTKDISDAEDLEKKEIVFYAVLKALENIGKYVRHI